MVDKRSDMALESKRMQSKSAKARSEAAALMGRKGGAANTEAQQRAREQNAKRAGRPRRVCLHCGEPVVGGHVDRGLDDTCGQHGWRWQQRSADPPPPNTTLTVALSQADVDLLVSIIGHRKQPAVAAIAARLRMPSDSSAGNRSA